MRSPPQLKAGTMIEAQMIINSTQPENSKRVSYIPCYVSALAFRAWGSFKIHFLFFECGK